MSSSQRWYSNSLPAQGDFVMVRCNQINDMGCYCELLEYGGREGLIPAPEVSKQRIQHIRQAISIGRIFVALVLQVDASRGYVDLSKKRVTETDFQDTELRYYQGKRVFSILQHLAQQTHTSLADRFQQLWDFSGTSSTYSSLVPFLESISSTHPYIPHLLQRYLTPPTVDYQAEIDLICFSSHGIDGIRQSLQKGIQSCPGISIKLLRSPTYLIQYSTKDTDQALIVLQKLIDTIASAIRTFGGELTVQKEPRLITKEDQLTLQERIHAIQRESEQISGDSDSDTA